MRGACDQILRQLGRSGAGERERLVAWIYAIARGALRDVARSPGGLEPDANEAVPAPKRTAGSAAGNSRLRAALRSLPSDVRAIVRARSEERLSFEEIARRNGWSEAAVRRSYHRALAHVSHRAPAPASTSNGRGARARSLPGAAAAANMRVPCPRARSTRCYSTSTAR